MANHIKIQHYYFENLFCTRELNKECLEIWLFPYKAIHNYLEQCYQYLSENEKSKVLRYRSIADKQKAILRRGLLRLLLSNYLNRNTQQIEISYGEYGKPYLRDENICFSLSHSHEFLVYSFSKTGLLGIDVEAIQDLEDASEIAALIFSEKEQAQLKQGSQKKQQKAFFNGWTRKEAYGKAVGNGLHQGLCSITIPLDDMDEGSCLSIQKNNVDLDIMIYPFFPENGYVAAIASDAAIKEIRFCKLR